MARGASKSDRVDNNAGQSIDTSFIQGQGVAVSGQSSPNIVSENTGSDQVASGTSTAPATQSIVSENTDMGSRGEIASSNIKAPQSLVSQAHLTQQQSQGGSSLDVSGSFQQQPIVSGGSGYAESPVAQTQQQNTGLDDYALYNGIASLAPTNPIRRQQKEEKPVEKVEEQIEQSSAEVANGVPNGPDAVDTGVAKQPRPKPNTNKAPKRKARLRSLFNNASEKPLHKQIAQKFRMRKLGSGTYTKLLPSTKLGMRQVGIGYDEFKAMMLVPNNALSSLALEYDVDTSVVTEGNLLEIAKQINDANIWVAVTKSPVSEKYSYQKRMLRIMVDMSSNSADGMSRGIFLHPVMAKEFNADFDGDDSTISYDPAAIKIAKDPMSYLIGTDGNVKIADDFFPHAPLVDGYSEGKTAEDFVKENMFQGYPKEGMDALAKSVVEFSRNGDARALSRSIQEYAQKNTTNEQDHFQLMSMILKITYDQMLSYQRQYVFAMSGAVWTDLPQTRTEQDDALVKVATDLVDGRPCANFQEAKVMLNKFVGNDPKGSAPFRISADMGKAFKLSSKYRIGNEYVIDSDEAWEDVYTKTLLYAEAKLIGAEEDENGKSTFYSDEMRKAVRTEVGFPSMYNSFFEFLKAFCVSYNKNADIINQADASFSTQMGLIDYKPRFAPIKLDSWHTLKFGELANPLLKIYRDVELGTLFPALKFNPVSAFKDKASKRDSWKYAGNLFMLSHYKNMVLNSFAYNNHLIKNQSNQSKDNAKPIATCMDSNGNWNDNELSYRLAMAIADKKTADASEFNSSIYGVNGSKNFRGGRTAMSMLSDVLDAINDDLGTNNRRDLESSRDMFVLIGPKMMRYFGMASIGGITSSEYGRAMLEHRNDMNMLGGIREAMVYAYVRRNLDAYVSEMRKSENTAQQKYLTTKIAREQSLLSSKSDCWNAIMMELSSTEAWPKFKNNECTRHAEYWKNCRHDSLDQFMRDVTVPKSDRDAVLADMVRYHLDYDYVTSMEMSFQLELGVDADAETSSRFKYQSDMESHFESWNNKRTKNLQASAKSIYRRIKEDPSFNLKDEIKKAAESECYSCYVPSAMVADSIAFSMSDKEWGQTEKNRQHPGMNNLFTAVCYNKDIYGLDSQYQTDGRAIGMIPMRCISTRDVLRVLNGGIIYTNNEMGERVVLSNETLFGTIDPSQDQLVDFMFKHPCIASALRPNIASTAKGKISDGGAYAGAAGKPFDVAYSQRDEVSNYMYDHPGFLGLVSILTPMNGAVASDRSRKVETNIHNVTDMLMYFAANPDTDIEAELADKLNLDQAHLEDMLQSDFWKSLAPEQRAYYDQFLGNLEMEDDAVTEAEDILDNITKNIHDYVEEIRSRFDAQSFRIEGYDHTTMVYDQASIASYWDMVAEATACRTAVMTGIEGSQTRKFAFWASLVSAEDKYASLLAYHNNEEELAKLVGCNTNFGVFDGDISAMIARATDEDGNVQEIVVEVPEGFVVQDRTTDYYGKQVSSLATYFEHRRSKGAEEGNLKAKKTALDGLDSITKFTRFSGIDYRDITEEINQHSDPFEAKMVLAKRLETAAKEARFDDLTLSNYMCLADVMVIQLEDGTFAVRSLDQLMTAIKNKVAYEVGEVNRDNYEDAKNVAMAVLQDTSENAIGVKESTESAADFLERIVPVNSVASAYVMKSGRHSSFTRNKALRDIIDNRCPDRRSERVVKKRMEEMIADSPRLKSMQSQIAALPIVKDYIFAGEVGGLSVNCNGPLYLKVLDTRRDNDYTEALLDAKNRGNTVMVKIDNPEKLNEVIETAGIAEEAIPVSEDTYIIPFFKIELDGMSDVTNTGGRFWIGHRPKSRIVASVETLFNWFGQGDAHAIMTADLADNVHPFETGSLEINSYELFSNTRAAYSSEAVFLPSLCSRTDVESKILNNIDSVTIDYGMPEWDPRFEKQKAIIDAAIARFFDHASEYGPDFTKYGQEMHPGEIFGFAMMTISDPQVGRLEYTLAPIIPVPIDKGPTSFTIEVMPRQFLDGKLGLSYTHTSDARKHSAKFYDTSGASNKMMTTFESIRGMLIDNSPIGIYYPVESTASRRLGTDRRMKTLASLGVKARLKSYNFAECAKSFPGNLKIRQELLDNPWQITRSDWVDIMETETFHTDPILNAFVKMQCKRFYDNGGNPSDFLANRFGGSITEDGAIDWSNGKVSDIDYEHEAMLNPGIPFADAMLRFYHELDPSLCPYGLEGDATNTTFKPDLTPGYNYGALMVDVPVPSEDGKKVAYIPKGGYAYFGYGFFGDDNMGWTRYNVEGASRYMDAFNTMALNGEELDDYSIEQVAAFSQTDVENIPFTANSIEVSIQSQAQNRITSFRGDYSFLSNFYNSPVEVDGIVFDNAEAAFQSGKGNSESFVGLSAKEARSLGKSMKNIRSDWDSVRVDRMTDVIRSKFSNPDLAQKLLATGDAELVEGNTWGDNFWGNSGNMLGKILMQVRDELKGGE